MANKHRLPIRHHRAWYFLLIFCVCGRRWRGGECPRARRLIAAPLPPPVGRAAVVVVTPGPPPPSPRLRSMNQRLTPMWNSPSGQHEIGRAGRLTPAQAVRARGADGVRKAEWV